MISKIIVWIDKVVNEFRLDGLSIARFHDGFEKVSEKTGSPDLGFASGDVYSAFMDQAHTQIQGRRL